MKDELISKAIDCGLDKESLEQKYAEYFSYGGSLGQTSEEQAKYVEMMLKRHIKKELMTPRELLAGVVLGDRLTDWGAINRRIHNGTVFPADHKRAGQTIPEHDYTKVVLFYNYASNDIVTITVRGEVDFPLKAGFEYNVKLKKGMKDKNFIWEVGREFKENGEVDVRKLITSNLKKYIVASLKDLESTQNGLVIVNAQSIVNINDAWDDFVVTIDDESLDIDSKKVNIRVASGKVHFSDQAQNVIFIADIFKKGDDSIELQGYAAFPKKEDIVVTQKLEDTSSSNMV